MQFGSMAYEQRAVPGRRSGVAAGPWTSAPRAHLSRLLRLQARRAPTLRPVSAPIQDKRGLFAHPHGAKLDLGCGSKKIDRDYVGVDVIDGPDVDVVGDVEAVLAALLPEHSRGSSPSHFVEHVIDVETLLQELARTMAAGGA